MQNKGKYYITTAIAYTSGKPHIGNSYEIVLADAIARYKRRDGFDVHFQEQNSTLSATSLVMNILPKKHIRTRTADSCLPVVTFFNRLSPIFSKMEFSLKP